MAGARPFTVLLFRIFRGAHLRQQRTHLLLRFHHDNLADYLLHDGDDDEKRARELPWFSQHNNNERTKGCNYTMSTKAIDSDIDEEGLLSRGRPKLGPGSIIEYTHPIGVYGDPQHFRRAVVLSVRPAAEDTRLVLNNGDVLPECVKVKVVKVVSGNELIDPSDGGTRFRSISEYLMEDDGVVTGREGAERFTDLFGTYEASLGAGAAASAKFAAMPKLQEQLMGDESVVGYRGGTLGSPSPAAAASPEVLASGESLPKQRCSIQRCPGSPERLLTCSNGCGRPVHPSCSDRLVMQKNSLPVVEGEELHFCTKGCHDKYKKQHSTSTVGLAWHNDGKGGRNDPNTSESIIVRWLMTDDNYNKWRCGPGQGGRTKNSIGNMLAQMCNNGEYACAVS